MRLWGALWLVAGCYGGGDPDPTTDVGSGDTDSAGTTPPPPPPPPDADGDGLIDSQDNCATVTNPDQTDTDLDLVGDLCDNCVNDANTDQVDADGDAIGDACPCDACLAGQWCATHPEYTVCQDDCPPELQGPDATCCPLGSRWSAEAYACLLPDLWVEETRLAISKEITNDFFGEADCEIVEGCVSVPGQRRLLRFDTTTPNTGEGDLYMGPPGDRPDIFTFSPCHGHYHFDTYAVYELVDASGNVVAPGHKQAFCLLDFEPWLPGITIFDAKYDCDRQGITLGFADTYDSFLDCQFVDITDVQEGEYTLRVTLNTEHLLAETDYTNNVGETQVFIPAN